MENVLYLLRSRLFFSWSIIVVVLGSADAFGFQFHVYLAGVSLIMPADSWLQVDEF